MRNDEGPFKKTANIQIFFVKNQGKITMSLHFELVNLKIHKFRITKTWSIHDSPSSRDWDHHSARTTFFWQILQKRFLWHKSILCNHNSGLTLQSTHENIHVTDYGPFLDFQLPTVKSPLLSLTILCSNVIIWTFL